MVAAKKKKKARKRRAPLARRPDPTRRKCALHDCEKLLPAAARAAQIYCCDGHKSLACVRRRRAREATCVPALLSGAICPVDGRVFPIEMFARRRGRPRRYDCDTCKAIAKEMRRYEDEAAIPTNATNVTYLSSPGSRR